MTMSDDGQLMMYSFHTNKYEKRVIVELRKQGDKWSEPVVASFSGKHKDIEPMFLPGGGLLFFSSDRPIDQNDQPGDYNIWYVERLDNGEWNDPIPMGPKINTAKDEFYPSLTRDGSLYFTAARDDSKGTEDIYYSRFLNGKYLDPVSLDTAVNSKTYEFNAFVDPKDQYIIFTSYKRPDGFGGGDLYISFKTNGKWQPAKNLGSAINSPALEYCPYVSPDGKTLYFTSNRGAKYSGMTTSVDQIKTIMDGPYNGFDNIFYVDFKEVLKRIK